MVKYEWESSWLASVAVTLLGLTWAVANLCLGCPELRLTCDLWLTCDSPETFMWLSWPVNDLHWARLSFGWPDQCLTWAVTGLWLTCDWPVIDLWLTCDWPDLWLVWAVTVLWLTYDLPVVDLLLTFDPPEWVGTEETSWAKTPNCLGCPKKVNLFWERRTKA